MLSLQGELIIAVTYGYQVHGRHDKLLEASKSRIKFGAEIVLPGALLINHIPLCMYFCFSRTGNSGLSTYPSVRYIPEWLPWFSYKQLISFGRDLGNQVLYPPMRFVKESMVSNYRFP